MFFIQIVQAGEQFDNLGVIRLEGRRVRKLEALGHDPLCDGTSHLECVVDGVIKQKR